MESMNFDNIYLLLVGIPLLAVVLVPYFWAIRKSNRTKSVVVSLVLHLAMVVFVTFALSGMSITTVMTKTEVVVLADVSYSATRNESEIDKSVMAIKNALPQNSDMSVVAFGRDYKVITKTDEKFTTVKNSGVDDSATNIAGALRYVENMFSDEAIKRVVIVTDGKQTDGANGDVITAVSALMDKNIKVDAIYLDSNITEKDLEVQISDATYNHSTYLGHKAQVQVMVQSSQENVQSILRLYNGGKEIDSQAETLAKGYNIFTFALPTHEAGVHNYDVVIETADDETVQNNKYSFTQTVVGKVKVLLITTLQKDVERVEKMYDGAEVTKVLAPKDEMFDAPFTVESLVEYDEIILSEVDVRNIRNASMFVNSLDIVVAKYGKSLITFGNVIVPNSGDKTLQQLEEMLPIRMGNSDQEPKLLGIVIDTSRSMEFTEKLIMAKETANRLVNVLSDQDFVSIVAFSGDVSTVFPSAQVGGNRERIQQLINGLKPTQGTVIGSAMERMQQNMENSSIDEKQVMLISDGRTYSHEEDNPVEITKTMRENGIVTSAINIGTVTTSGDENASVAITLMKDIATNGGGEYYEIQKSSDVNKVILSEIAVDVMDTVIEKTSEVKIAIESDDSVKDISSSKLPQINGYVVGKAKPSATTVITTEYEKTSGAKVAVPVYAYRGYHNGRVSVFTSALSGAWISEWIENESAEKFFDNVLLTNTPKERVDRPYLTSITHDGQTARIELQAETLNYEATAKVKFTQPNGETEEKIMLFDSSKYVCELNINSSGKYEIEITYSYDEKEFGFTEYYTLSYAPEYDRFVSFDEAELTKAIRRSGKVYTPQNIELKNSEDEIQTVTFYCTLPFMIITVVLFVVDLIVRLVSRADIKAWLKRKGGQK